MTGLQRLLKPVEQKLGFFYRLKNKHNLKVRTYQWRATHTKQEFRKVSEKVWSMLKPSPLIPRTYISRSSKIDLTDGRYYFSYFWTNLGHIHVKLFLNTL